MRMPMLAAVAAIGVALCDGSAASATPVSGAAIGAAADVGTVQTGAVADRMALPLDHGQASVPPLVKRTSLYNYSLTGGRLHCADHAGAGLRHRNATRASAQLLATAHREGGARQKTKIVRLQITDARTKKAPPKRASRVQDGDRRHERPFRDCTGYRTIPIITGMQWKRGRSRDCRCAFSESDIMATHQPTVV
jgi:hypothetical protein